ncbi:MAG: hypothetical protein KZQ64_08295 [gamma proteobacterium symbiont of Bathyaustriella thionipta]|nr:hypothetical protein [gamma proteobacterium symbiont of Bathyaustriella thionipta]MCU7950813.1 hypothetical protein [gamma proteobacterium symbiont of Bathyaustriella thionipta]MCU7953373.1 hypothetical protein [gamma proteobacterium symbiont of Bathyaustriella thionipta]MCU7957325.1 hypothetical protein [gamma proteobacterium symbiont of Bathyaustriella thionipta]MCU7967818.1 hypothetical protein [gamma proteobacterium symbiont of Bathyaustriella thionipta]
MQKKIWYYVSLFPFVAAVIGMSLAYLSYSQQWGGDEKIATVIAVFFCEIVMVIAVFGSLSYMKQEKSSMTKNILIMNISIAVTGALAGIYIFLA